MTVQKVVGLCADLLQYDFDKELFEIDCDVAFLSQTKEKNKNFRLLVNCVGLCEAELACDYFPLKATQEFFTNSASREDFDKVLHEVVRVRNEFGEEVRFVCSIDGVVADCKGKMTVDYHYRPKAKGYFDKLDRGSSKMDERLFAYGAIAEFCFLSGMYDEATLWDKRYKDLIQVALYENKSMKIPQRRWC